VNQVIPLHSDASPLESLAPQLEVVDPGAPELLAADIAASELLLQLGHEYFTVDTPGTSVEPRSQLADHRLRIDPQAIANTCPPVSDQRDFWEEVSATCEKAGSWLSKSNTNILGTSTDPVAHAIATVSASYTLAASEKRLAAGAAIVGSATTQAASKETARGAHDVHKPQTRGSEPSIADALAHLFGFEEVCEIEYVRELDPQVFTHARELAARALVAAATNRNSALKSAEGRRG
jgi:hypothetical protein